MSLKKRTFAGVGWNTAANAANQLTALLVFIILARQLSLADFGAVMLAVLVVNLLMVVIKEGVAEHIVQTSDFDRPYLVTAFWVITGIGLALTLLAAFAIAPLMGLAYGASSAHYLMALSTTLVVSAIGIPNGSVLRRDFNFRTAAFRTFAVGAVTGIIGVILAFAGFGAWALIWSRILAAGGSTLILMVAAPVPHWGGFSWATAGTILRYATPVTLSRLVSYASGKAVELILPVVLGTAALAVFRVGTRLVEALSSLLLLPIVTVSLSTYAQSKDRIAEVFLRSAVGLLGLLIPIYIGIAAVSMDLTTLLFGDKWHQSAWVMSIMCFVVAASVIRMLMVSALKAVGEAGAVFRVSLVDAATSLLCAVATAPFGPIASGVGVFFSAHLALLVNRSPLEKQLGVPVAEVARRIAPFCISAIVMFAAVQVFTWFIAPGWPLVLRLACSIVGGALIYVALMLLAFRNTSAGFLDEFASLMPQRLKPLIKKFSALLKREKA